MASASCQLVIMDSTAQSEATSSPASATRDCTAWRPQRQPIVIRASDVRERRKCTEDGSGIPTSSSQAIGNLAASSAPALLSPLAPDDELRRFLDGTGGPQLDVASSSQSAKFSSQQVERRARSACQRPPKASPRPSLPIASRRRGSKKACGPPLTEATNIDSIDGGADAGPAARFRNRGNRAGAQSSSIEACHDSASFSFETAPEGIAGVGGKEALQPESCTTPCRRDVEQPQDTAQDKRLGFGTTPIRQMPALSPLRNASDLSARRRSPGGSFRSTRGEPGTPGFGESWAPLTPTPLTPTCELRATEAALPPWFTCLPSPTGSPRNSPRTPQPEVSKVAKAFAVATGTSAASIGSARGRPGPRTAAGAPSSAVRRPRGEQSAGNSLKAVAHAYATSKENREPNTSGSPRPKRKHAIATAAGISKENREPNTSPRSMRKDASKGPPAAVLTSVRGVSLSRSPASRGGA